MQLFLLQRLMQFNKLHSYIELQSKSIKLILILWYHTYIQSCEHFPSNNYGPVLIIYALNHIQAAEKDNFLDHECRPYIDRKYQNLAPQAISFLVAAGEKFLEKD